ncbi:MAG: sulfide/dihydroorotate dehydrogenase-like FAD/NAD-binding protein [Bacteroidales bacterium]|nr:sulfide/dihydroorotate dehydrogenase-like FAD/NAD-binding protein [Bacteroidales bacterium]
MFKIVDKKQLTPLIYSLWVEAPRIASSAKPGQFLIVRTGENGERVPLTICDYDTGKGTVRIVVQIAGVSSSKICHLNVGDCLTDVAGPLGKPSDFMEIPEDDLKDKRYLFVAGGVGAAPVYPQAKYLYERGAHVDVIIGARNKDLIIMEDEMRKVCTNLYICTDDGSKGEKGVVTLLMERLCAPSGTQNGTEGAFPGDFAPSGTQNGTEGAFPGEAGVVPYDMCVAIGPMIMMKFATLMAKKLGLPITVSLNTLMVDGTGMCGACRVSVAGKTMFACVNGPEFNGYDVDFDEALRRQTLYRTQEQEANAAAGLDLRR